MSVFVQAKLDVLPQRVESQCPLLPINQMHSSRMVYRLPYCTFSHEQSYVEPLETKKQPNVQRDRNTV